MKHQCERNNKLKKHQQLQNKRGTIPIQGDGVVQEELQTKTKKKKRINYKKQEPQCNLLNAKLLNANSMDKK